MGDEAVKEGMEMITNQELQKAFNKVSEEEEKSHKRMIQRHKEIMEMIERSKHENYMDHQVCG